jgi:DNA helicase-2/ATP-dependent DNA helicase PcrA
MMLFNDAETSKEKAYLELLNPEQRKAVETTEGPVLIIAGAGSGKTRVLAYRVAHLIYEGVPPRTILALTFTNKAASEMKERISAIVGEEKSSQVWAGTFHSIFARLLRQVASTLGYTSSFSIYDTEDSNSLIRKILIDFQIDPKTTPPKSFLNGISKAKNDLKSWQDFAEDTSRQTKLFVSVYKEYEQRLRAYNAMDFDDILINMIRFLQLSPQSLEFMQKRFQYILIDEYQDTNRSQYISTKLLAEAHKNICVVGDDAQSIYAWRGADIRNILEFQKDYPDALAVRLEQNYRSTKNILSAANAVISYNTHQLKKELFTENPEGSAITLMETPIDRAEAERICQRILIDTSTRGDLQLRDIAILYRTNAQSQIIEDTLRKNNLKYTIIGGMSFYKRKEIKDILAYLKLLINPFDQESLYRVCDLTAGIGKASLIKVEVFAKMQRINLIEAFTKVYEIEGVSKKAADAMMQLATLVEDNKFRLEHEPHADVAITYIEQSNYLKMYSNSDDEEMQDRLRNIETFVENLRIYLENDENTSNDDGATKPTIQEYLHQMALISDIDSVDLQADRISVMTLHSAKGLEFDTVFLAGLEDGLFPLMRETSTKKDKEEERRLFYVGITRAKKKLYISYAKQRMRYGHSTFSGPSPFLSEIPEELFEQRHSLTNSRQVNSQVRKPTTMTSTSYFQNEIPEENYSQLEEHAMYSVGMMVRHRSFGEGKIMRISGSGESAQVEVAFKSVGSKKLMLKFAKLEIM